MLGVLADSKVEQSFANKCFASLMYSLNIQINCDVYMSLYELFQTDGFENLGINDYGKD